MASRAFPVFLASARASVGQTVARGLPDLKRGWLVWGLVGAGLILAGCAITLAVTPTCKPLDSDVVGQLAISPRNHGCTYSLAVGNFVLFDSPDKSVHSRDYAISLRLSNPSLATQRGAGISSLSPHDSVYLTYQAVAPGRLVLEDYDITIDIHP